MKITSIKELRSVETGGYKFAGWFEDDDLLEFVQLKEGIKSGKHPELSKSDNEDPEPLSVASPEKLFAEISAIAMRGVQMVREKGDNISTVTVDIVPYLLKGDAIDDTITE